MKKGQTNNPHGKPKGAKGKKTLEWEEFGRNLCTQGIKRAKRILSEAPDDKFMFYFQNLLEYFKPKLARTELVDKDGEALKFTPPQIILTVEPGILSIGTNGHHKDEK